MSVGSPDCITIGVSLEQANGERRGALIPPETDPESHVSGAHDAARICVPCLALPAPFMGLLE